MQIVLQNMLNSIENTKRGNVEKPILEGFTDAELETIAVFVRSFNYSVLSEKVIVGVVEDKKQPRQDDLGSWAKDLARKMHP